MHIEIYNPKVNSVKAGNIHSWAQANKLQAVIEIHRNAFAQASANGVETLVDYRQKSVMMLNLHKELAKLGWFDRGVKPANGNGGRQLQNPRLMWRAGIPYSLLELGFITNSKDNEIFDKNLSKISSIIISVAKASGIDRLGIVYGHGQGDPGALGLGRGEAEDVRKITFNQSHSTEKGVEIKLTKQEVEKIIDDKLNTFKNELLNTPASTSHWVDKDFNELNEFLVSNGVDPIESKQHNAVATRAILIRIANLIVKAIRKEK